MRVYPGVHGSGSEFNKFTCEQYTCVGVRQRLTRLVVTACWTAHLQSPSSLAGQPTCNPRLRRHAQSMVCCATDM